MKGDEMMDMIHRLMSDYGDGGGYGSGKGDGAGPGYGGGEIYLSVKGAKGE